MKQFEKQKSIGWFKLAEYVERGEKERALGIYKLLALSINNPAFAYQLEGDILLAFEDNLAKEKYLKSVELYLKQKQTSAAIGTLNHLILLEPNNLDYWQILTEAYLEYLPNKITTHLRNLISYKQRPTAQICVQKIIVKYQAIDNQIAINELLSEIELVDHELHDFSCQLLGL